MKHIKTLLPGILAGLTVMTINGPVSAEQMVMVCKQYPASQVQVTGKPTPSANTVQFRNPVVTASDRAQASNTKTWRDDPATTKQLAYLRRLLKGQVPSRIRTKGEASNMIKILLAAKKG